MIRKIWDIHKAVESYLENTSWVKNSCKGQSTEYSRVIPSQPSSDVSEEVFDSTAPELPSVYVFVFGKCTSEDFTVIPNEGILIDGEDN